MFTAIGAFFSKDAGKKIVGIGLAVVLLSGATVIFFGYKHIQSQNKEIGQLTADLIIEQKKVAAFEVAIKATNEALAKFSVISDDNDSQINKLNQTLATKNAALQAELKKLKDSPTPKTCSEAMDYLRDTKGTL